MSAIGLRVGPFEIRDEAVVPATGSWYRAHRTGLTRRKPAEVLVRLLGPAPSSRELTAVQRQFDVLRSLDDPRLPRPVALYEGSGALAVEAADAMPLDRVIEARLLGDVTMTPATLLDIALELVESLSHAHQRGHHHGHLSPANVCLSEDGRLWIWGFGDHDARPPFAWLPPERARSEATTAATDQWSLGALLVALVSGRTPWSPSAHDADPRQGDINAFVEPVARQWPALGRLARRMLEADPGLRFPSLHPVRLELLALARRAGGTSDRRALASWLERDRNGRTDPGVDAVDVGAIPVAEDEPPERSARIDALAGPAADESPESEQVTAPAPPPRIAAPSIETPLPMAPPRATPRVTATRSAPDKAPVIQDAHRSEDPGPRLRPRGPLVAEAMSVVRPDAIPSEVPEARINVEPPPVRPRPAISLRPRPTPGASAEDQVTEMAEDWLPTEMAELPDPLRPGIEPGYPREPIPTLPGMEAPEPVSLQAPKVVLPVTVEFDDEDEDDDLIAEDSEELVSVDDLSEEVAALADLDDEPVAVDDEPVAVDLEDVPVAIVAKPVARPAAIATVAPPRVMATFEEDEDEDDLFAPRPTRLEEPEPLVEVQIQFDDLDDLDDPDMGDVEDFTPEFISPRANAPLPTVVPFTDPHFSGPDSLGLDEDALETVPPVMVRRDGPSWVAPEGLSDEAWPWEGEPPLDLPEPANDPLIRAAPWVGVAAAASLALITVFNVIV